MKTSTQLHIVSGKGGTGKTSVAAALAMSLATAGTRVLLCEVEGRQGFSQLFETEPLPYEERLIAKSEEGGEVYALAIDPEAALLEYLQMYYRLGRVGKALDRFGIIDFATTIAPGVRDVLLTGKIYEAARRRIGGDTSPFVYDAVVIDAPPTGRITRFLGVSDDVAGLVKVGPIKNQSDSIMTMMRAEQTRVHLVTLLEEMPVQETLDGAAELERAGIHVGAFVLNLVRKPLLSEASKVLLESGELSEYVVAGVLTQEKLPESAAAGLLAEGAAHLERQALQNEQHAVLEQSGHRLVTLPMIPGGVDIAALAELAPYLKEIV
ncbi:MAG: ATPase [Aeromicrobium sp.]|nr:MAG: ATPase [Aeromicrobium sp.]